MKKKSKTSQGEKGGGFKRCLHQAVSPSLHSIYRKVKGGGVRMRPFLVFPLAAFSHSEKAGAFNGGLYLAFAFFTSFHLGQGQHMVVLTLYLALRSVS